MVPFILFLMTSVGAGQALSPRVGGCCADGAKAKAVPAVSVAEAGCAGCCDACPCKETGVCNCPICPCRSGACTATVAQVTPVDESVKARATTATANGACCPECAGGCPEGCCAGGCCSKAGAEPARAAKSCCSTAAASRS